ncbi:MAG: hypothetical protein HRU00_14015 [Myxococcales bacterium]|nr:hypothetical protein [Myxococcales bacterium]
MSESFPAAQKRPRAITRYTPANTNYIQIDPLEDWIKAVTVNSPANVRVAHWGVTDGDAIGTVTEYQVIPIAAVGLDRVVARRDGLEIYISGVPANEIELIAMSI